MLKSKAVLQEPACCNMHLPRQRTVTKQGFSSEGAEIPWNPKRRAVMMNVFHPRLAQLGLIRHKVRQMVPVIVLTECPWPDDCLDDEDDILDIIWQCKVGKERNMIRKGATCPFGLVRHSPCIAPFDWDLPGWAHSKRASTIAPHLLQP